MRNRLVLAILAGLLWAAAFPPFELAGLAWIAPGLLAAAALGKRGGESFRIGYVGGLTHYLVSLYWLLLIPYRWHGIPLGPAAGWLALSAFMALYPATWVWLVAGARVSSLGSRVPGLGSRVEAPGAEVGAEPGGEGRPKSLERIRDALAGSWAGRTVWAIVGAAVWVGLEMMIARFLGGFPWDLLGVSQYQLLPLVQVASVTGVYGVSFLMVWVSLALVSAGVMMLRRPTLRSVWIAELFLPLIVVAVVFNLGFRQMKAGAPEPRTLRVTLVQPSIPQTLIWNPGSDNDRFRSLLQLCEQALTHETDLLIWPESAIPKLLRYDKEIFEAVTGLAREHHVWMIVGADDAERPAGSTNAEDILYFNSSFLISPEGKLVDRYLKRSLVIFGEYIPLQHTLPFLKWFTPIQGGFTPGERPVPFAMPDLATQTSVLICFEDIFPHLGRSGVDADTDFLVNITNDGWFGESAAQWQHALTSVFRAVENGVPLVRCTNTGLTCWIDAQGRLRQVFRDRQGSIYGPGFMSVEIPLPAPGEHHRQTFYNRHGDWFGWACVAVGVVVLLGRAKDTFKTRRQAACT